MATTDDKINALDKRFDEVLGAMSNFAESVDKKFESVDKRFEAIDMKFESIDMRFDKIENKLDNLKSEFDDLKVSQNKLVNTIDGFIGRIDKYETELAARDHEIERLKRWIRQIADKTGVELNS